MKHIITYIFIFIFTSAFAGSKIKGQITDKATGEALIGVNIESEGKGAISDMDGNYEFELPEGKHVLQISYVGYKTINQEIDMPASDDLLLNFALEVEAKDLLGTDIVVSGSLYPKRASEEVISIETVKPKVLETSNMLRIDEIARRVSGLNVSDGQANIRAGSGWAYGVGSRVSVVLDGLTMLSPDRGDVKWTNLPTECVGEIEVLKGASSVLYGSSAMNGTISLITFKPTKTPVTKFTVFQSFITPPKRKIAKWWDFPIPSIGTSFMRAHKPTNNFEYTVGGSLYLNNSAYENGLEYLTRLTYRTKWTSKKNEKINWGIAGSFMYNREYEFFYFQNYNEGMYKASADNKFENIRLTVDPYFTIYDKKDNRHEIKTRMYFNRPSFNTKTVLEDLNYLFSKNYTAKDFVVNAGFDEQVLWVDVPAFVGGGKKVANLMSVFTQLDKKYKKLTLTGGVRFEFFKYEKNMGVTGTVWRKPSGKIKFYLPGQWRAGLNYEITKNTFIRFNIGQAYRFPSFAEQFVDEHVGNSDEHYTVHITDTISGVIYSRDSAVTVPHATLAILPNVNLVPEYGWTSEIGIQHIISRPNLPHYRGQIDAAFYWQEYKQLVEPTAVNDPNSNALVKLQFQNISRARIAGWDISFKNDLTFKKHAASFNVGYTYALPAELNAKTDYGFDNVGKYIKYLFKYTVRQFGSDTADQILKYRNRHLLTLDFEYTYNNFFNIGFDARFYSKMENFDKIFILLPGVYEFIDHAPKRGYFVLNTRTFFTIKKKHNLGFLVKNILNTEYWLRAGKVEQPRSVTLQYRLSF